MNSNQSAFSKKVQKRYRTRRCFPRKNQMNFDPQRLEFIKNLFKGKIDENVIEIIYEDFSGNETEIIKKLNEFCAEIRTDSNSQNSLSLHESNSNRFTSQQSVQSLDSTDVFQRSLSDVKSTSSSAANHTSPPLHSQDMSSLDSNPRPLNQQLQQTLDKTKLITKFKDLFPSLDENIITLILEEKNWDEVASLTDFKKLTSDSQSPIESNQVNDVEMIDLNSEENVNEKETQQIQQNCEKTSRNNLILNPLPDDKIHNETRRPNEFVNTNKIHDDDELSQSDSVQRTTNTNSSQNIQTSHSLTSQESLDFLNSMFPEYDVLFLKMCLEQSNNDLEKAIEIILPTSSVSLFELLSNSSHFLHDL